MIGPTNKWQEYVLSQVLGVQEEDRQKVLQNLDVFASEEEVTPIGSSSDKASMTDTTSRE